MSYDHHRRLLASDVNQDLRCPSGPFHNEPRVCVRDIDRSQRRQLLLQALDGVELGAWDQTILDWLCVWEWSTLLPIAGWIQRAKTEVAGHP